MAKGLVDKGSEILYKANVTSIILEHGKAVSVGPSLIMLMLVDGKQVKFVLC